MSALVEFADCKLCGAKLELPLMPEIVNKDKPLDQKQCLDLGKVLMKHLWKHHRDIQAVSVFWAAMFSEYFFLSMFDSDNKLFRLNYDQKRLSLLRVCGRRLTDAEIESFSSGVAVKQVRDLYEERELEAALEAAGLKVPEWFLERKTVVVGS